METIVGYFELSVVLWVFFIVFSIFCITSFGDLHQETPQNLDNYEMQLYLNLLLPTDKHPCQSTIQRTKTPLTGTSTGWQWTEWSHWGTYPPTGEPPAVMTSTVSITTKITSVESLRRPTSLPSLVLVSALRQSLSAFVVTLSHIPCEQWFLTSTSTSTLFKFENIAKDTLGLACS